MALTRCWLASASGWSWPGCARSMTPAVVVDRLDDQDAALLTLLLSALKRTSHRPLRGVALTGAMPGVPPEPDRGAYLVGRSVSWVNKRLALAERLWPKAWWNWSKQDRSQPAPPRRSPACHSDVQQVFASQVVMDQLAKSVVRKIRRGLQRSRHSLRRSGNPSWSGPGMRCPWWLPPERGAAGRTLADISPEALAGQRMRNVHRHALFRWPGRPKTCCQPSRRWTGQNEADAETRVDALWRFTRLAKACFEDSDFSPGKNRDGGGRHDRPQTLPQHQAAPQRGTQPAADLPHPRAAPARPSGKYCRGAALPDARATKSRSETTPYARPWRKRSRRCSRRTSLCPESSGGMPGTSGER